MNGDNVSFVAENVEGTPTMVEFMQQLQEEGSLTVRVENGSIVEMGNHEELLLQKGFYHELWHSQFAES